MDLLTAHPVRQFLLKRLIVLFLCDLVGSDLQLLVRHRAFQELALVSFGLQCLCLELFQQPARLKLSLEVSPQLVIAGRV